MREEIRLPDICPKPYAQMPFAQMEIYPNGHFPKCFIPKKFFPKWMFTQTKKENNLFVDGIIYLRSFPYPKEADLLGLPESEGKSAKRETSRMMQKQMKL